MYMFLFSVVLTIISAFTLSTNGDVADDIRNFRDDLKVVLGDVQQLMINQNNKITASFDSVETKLTISEIDQEMALLLSNQTFEECGSKIKNFTTNFVKIQTKLDDIDHLKNDIKNIDIKNQKNHDEVQNVQNTIKDVFTKISNTENSLTNVIQINADTQNRKLTDFENKMTNSLKEIENKHQIYLANIKKMEDDIEQVLKKIIHIEQQDINLSIQTINKAILDNQNNQNVKFDQLIFKVSEIEAEQKISNNLNQQSLKKVNDMETNLSDIKNEISDMKNKNEGGKNQILNSVNSEISDVKKEVTGQNSVVHKTKAIENSLKKIEDLTNKVKSSEASLTTTITNTGQNLQTTMNTLQGKVSTIQQNTPDNSKINEIYRIADYMKRVACSNPFITHYCNQNYF
nr:intermediate filament protein ifb-1-like [Onthophagus taurus]